MYALKYSNTINVLFLIAMKLRRLNKKKWYGAAAEGHFHYVRNYIRSANISGDFGFKNYSFAYA